MKKLVCILFVAVISVLACKSDDSNIPETYPVLNPEEQKEYDDLAIKSYLEGHYFDEKGRVKVIPKDDSTKKKLSSFSETLPSGVVVVINPDSQPINGTEVTDEKVISIMLTSFAARAVWSKDNNAIGFIGNLNFYNTIDVGGSVLRDPKWYYAKKKDIEDEQKRLDQNPNNTFKVTKSFFEIEGFQEAIKKFKSFDKDPKENYKLQGLIIVPSRLAFGKEPHYNYIGLSLNDHTFFFNFQLYKVEERTEEEK